MYAIRPQTIIGNEYYQKEICQSPRYCQLITMCLLPGEQVPVTTEPNICKVLQIMSGTGVLHVFKDEDSKTRKHLMAGICVMVLPGSAYRIMNNGNKPLKMLLNNTPPIQGFQNMKRPEAGSAAAVKQTEIDKNKDSKKREPGNKKKTSQGQSTGKKGNGAVSKESSKLPPSGMKPRGGTGQIKQGAKSSSTARNRETGTSSSSSNRISQTRPAASGRGSTNVKREKRPQQRKPEVESEESSSDESSDESC